MKTTNESFNTWLDTEYLTSLDDCDYINENML